MLWWTFQNLVIASVLAALVWLACRSGRVGPVGRHALWLVVLVKLLTPPLVVWPLAVHDPIGLTKPAARAEPAHAVAAAARVAPLAQRPAVPPDPAPALTRAESEDGFDLSPSEEPQDFTPAELPSAIPSASPPRGDPVSPAANLDTAPSRSRWLEMLVPVLGGVWLAGGVAFAALQCVRIGRLLVRLRRAAPAGPELAEQVNELAARLGIRSVRTRVIAGMESPAILGLHRPVLLWPAELPNDLPPQSVRGLIVHELAHVKRRDHWVGWLELLAGCLWWWNPLFWYVRHQVRENAELACDGWVVAALPRGGRRAYAEGLLAICEFISRRNAPMPAVGVNTGGRRFLERRLAMILRENVPLRLPRLGLLSVALLAVMTLPAWSEQQRESESPRDDAGQSSGKVEQRLKAESVGRSAARPAPSGRTGADDDVRMSPQADRLARATDAANLPDDARKLLDQFRRAQDDARRKYEAAVREERETLLKELHRLHDLYAAQGQRAAADAIADRIRQLDGAVIGVVGRPFVPGTGGRTATVRPPQPTAPARVRASADPGNLVQYRDRVGKSFVFDVTGRTDGAIWGSGTYTDDSALATAAVHAGVLRDGQRGLVRVTVLAGRDSYSGSTRNGVTSSDYGSWEGSYRVASAEPPLAGVPYGDVASNLAGRLADAVRPDPGNLVNFRDQVGRVFTFDVTGADPGAIWGAVWGGENGIYTDDSSLAAAAVHAGVLRLGQRGNIRVSILPGRDSYTGSERNGIRSADYGPWDGSYRIVGRADNRNDRNDRNTRPGYLPRPVPPLREPPNFENLRDRVGIEFDVQVTGFAEGSVWGGNEGIYTDDSSLAAAAVHAGLLKNGEQGVIRVRIVPPQDHYAGSNRNGVTSESWESWGGSFQLLGIQGDGPRGGGGGGYRGDGLKDSYLKKEKPQTGADDGTAKDKDKTILRLPERGGQIDLSRSVGF